MNIQFIIIERTKTDQIEEMCAEFYHNKINAVLSAVDVTLIVTRFGALRQFPSWLMS